MLFQTSLIQHAQAKQVRLPLACAALLAKPCSHSLPLFPPRPAQQQQQQHLVPVCTSAATSMASVEKTDSDDDYGPDRYSMADMGTVDDLGGMAAYSQQQQQQLQQQQQQKGKTGRPSKSGRKKQPMTDEENEEGLRWLARSLMGVYAGFGRTEDEALQELKRLGVRCYSVHNAATRRFSLEDRRLKGSFSRPQLIKALNLQLNPGCTGTTVRKQFRQTMEKMSPEEAEKGIRWLAEGLSGAFVGMGQTVEETMDILKQRGVSCTCISEGGTKRYFSIFGMPGRFVGRPAVVQALKLQVLDRAKAAKTVGGSVASTFEVNEEENEAALCWLAGHILIGLPEMGTLEEVLDWLKRSNVRCVRIEKRATNPRRFFQVGDNPQVYPGLTSTLRGLGLME